MKCEKTISKLKINEKKKQKKTMKMFYTRTF